MNLLIDGSNVLWRANWIATSTNSIKGKYGDVSILLNMLKGYKNMYPSSTMWMVWDRKLSEDTNPRYDDHAEYKAGREDVKDTVFGNSDEIIELLESINIRNFYPHHLEADDGIAWLSRKGKSIIFSADHDLAQLISPTCSMYHINRKKIITLDMFEQEFEVPVEHFILYKSIIGDPADNIIGIPGYGKKRGRALAKQLYENWEGCNIDASLKEIVAANKRLTNLVESVFHDEEELRCYEEQYITQTTNRVPARFSVFEEHLKEMHLNSHTKHIDQWRNLFNESNLNSILKRLKILQ